MSELMNTGVQHLKDVVNVDVLLEWYEKYMSKYTNTRAKRISIGVAISLLWFARSVYKKSVPPKQLRHFPHVSYFSFMKNLLMQKESTYNMFHRYNQPLIEQTHGFYLRPERSGWVVHVSNPIAVKQIFMKSEIFPKLQSQNVEGTFNNHFFGNDNILLSNGDTWKKHRKLVNPAFHKASPVKLFGNTAVEMFEMLEESYPNTDSFVIDFGNLMDRVTLDIIGRAGFDFDFNSTKDPNSKWKKIYHQVMSDQRNIKFIFFPALDRYFRYLMPARMEAWKRLNEFLNMLDEVIEHKRKVLQENIDQGIEEHEKDLLTLMLEGEMRGEGVLTQEQFIGNLVIFFIAGHDTTANALNSTVYHLASNPDIQEKARQEVIDVLCPEGEGEQKEDVLPTMEDTKKFVYLNQIMKESLRINGPVVHLVSPRVVQKDVELAGQFVPKDTIVNVNLYDLHHNEEVWSDPYKFNPDRFGEGGEAEQMAQGGLAWTPFANGSRQCIGMNFSLNEQRVFLSMMLRRYEFSLPENSTHKERYVTGNTLISQPINLQIQFKKRF
ncbi:cytochrome P-450 cyp509A1 [Hesseltinella vesiculosa]|uniref:Cytochrome P-450 cyp509A1 n=1 Tax=Hesseltinella vesiculosa TaxID=101127 RepID=A0A1X2G2J7_9FUNG|nr:cytochrome P-450 cyp509A1 [Hesseltinella vesiculosa]